MSLAENEVTDLLKEAALCYKLKPIVGWSVGGTNIQKVKLIIDIIINGTCFIDRYREVGISEKTLRTELHSKFIPNLKRGGNLTYYALKSELKIHLKTVTQSKRIFVFPTNLDTPITNRFVKTYKISDTKIIWYTKSSFQQSKFNCKAIQKEISEYYPKRTVSSYVVVEIRGNERQFSAEEAHNYLKLFCGIVNLSLFMNRTHLTWSVNQIRTISDITGSPYYFEYTNRKRYVSRWISEDYTFSKPKRLDNTQIQRIDDLISDIIKINKRYDMHKYFKRFLIMYQEAISSPDKVTSFLKFWSILELLTFLPKKKADYILLVNRILATFTVNSKLKRRKLEFLREKRNNLVHTQTGEITEDNLNYLRNTCENLFRVCLSLTRGYKSLDRIIFLMDNGQKPKKQLKKEIEYLKFLYKESKR